jgi:glycerophosphoryl diester phosphodiesterase
MEATKPLVFAHRGASGYEFENTIPAFEKAVELGADGLESDAWLLTDGEIVLHHDKGVEIKEKGLHANISNLTLDQVKEVTLPNGAQIPTFREFLEKFSNQKAANGNLLEFSIDLQDLKVGGPIIKLLEEFDIMDRIVLCATSSMPLKKVRQISPNVRLVASNQEDQIKDNSFSDGGKMVPLNLYAFNIQANHYKHQFREILDKNGLKCFIWDLHTEKDLRKYLPFLPHAIYSNFPDLALQIRDEVCL